MGNFIKCILLFYFIKICFTIVPLWNFDSSAIPLIVNDKTNYTYDVFSKNFMGFIYNITKTLYMRNGSLEQENKLYLENEYFGITSYDDIESAYNISDNYYVCPKGKHYVHRYYRENREIKSEILKNQTEGDWDLHCFMQHDQKNKNSYHYLFIFYLGIDNLIYNFDLDHNSFIQTLDIYNGIYAYKWRITYIDNNENLGIQMFAIVKEYENITLKDLRFNVTRGEKTSYWEEKNNQRYLGKVKSHFLAFFSDFHFYWINYNKSDISDFESGYYNDEEITKDNINNININTSQKSPFEFYDNFTIDTIKFIYGNKYVYYKIHKNDDNNISYHGIVDVILNRIVFNTDKDIKEFKPYSSNSFLAITNDKAYKICIIRGEGDNCVESCTDNQYIYDSTVYNKCGGGEGGCKSNVILKPNDICINSCNTSIFNLINETECWLCKDLDDKKWYKLLNSSICLEKLLNHSHIVNENLYLIDCDKYFKFDENSSSCIPSQCHKNCLACEEYSENDDKQNCIECIGGLFLYQKNCSSDCLIKYYKDPQNKRCQQCDDSCKTCSNATTCDTCDKGKFLNNILKCEKCDNNCESCSISENNCLTCKKDSKFRYFYNHSCYEKCPNGTTSDNDTLACIDINDEKNKPKGNECKSDNKNKYLLIFIIIAGILLLLILFCCIRRCCCKKKVSDEKIMEEINTELVENKNLVDE